MEAEVSIVPAPTEAKSLRESKRDRVVRAAVTAVYDQYCSSAIAELEESVVDLIGQPLPKDDDQ